MLNDQNLAGYLSYHIIISHLLNFMSCDLPGQYEKNARRKPLEMRVWAAKGKAFSF